MQKQVVLDWYNDFYTNRKPYEWEAAQVRPEKIVQNIRKEMKKKYQKAIKLTWEADDM